MADSAAARSVFAWRPRQRHLVALDFFAAAALTGVFLLLSIQRDHAMPDPAWLAVIALMGFPVAVRRFWPVLVFGIVTAAAVTAAVFDIAREPFLASAFALYWIAATMPRPRWVPTGAIAGVSVFVLLAGLMVGSPGLGVNGAAVELMGLALAGMAWTAGRAVHERRAYMARSARQLVARAVSEERLRIARELHDIVAHHIGVITVKAGVVNHVLPIQPPEAGEALRVIEVASRAAMAEMRHMLGVLRSGAAAEDETGPQPGLSALPELIDRAATAGVEVDVHTRNVTDLPEGVDRSVYRILQEALTNVMKHAAPTRCRVAVEADRNEVLIDVSDEGINGHPGRRPVTTDGHGLIGMQERVALYGGDLRAGPRPEGGFAVLARLPY